MPILRTKRLVLRPIEESDAEALHGFWTDPAVRRYLWDNQVIPVEKVLEIIADSERCFRSVGSGLFAIERAGHSGELIGFCGHRFMDERELEMLYGIQPRFWGEGMVTEAAHEVLRHGFETCGLLRVFCATDTPNQRSVRVMQRLGMVFEQRCQHNGLDTVFYSLSGKDFALLT